MKIMEYTTPLMNTSFWVMTSLVQTAKASFINTVLDAEENSGKSRKKTTHSLSLH